MTAPRTERADAALELVNVSKQYPGSPPVRALDDVSMRIDHGELIAIVGPSGSGKSTMLNVMGTLDLPTSGSVMIDGRDVAQFSERKLSAVRSHLIGFVFQSFFLLDGVTAIDNVANGLLYSGERQQLRRQRAAAALETVGLGHRLTHVPNQMSGGERQRVAIARAIVNEPAIVLADEPTGNLDTKSSEAVMNLLDELNRAGSTIVVITHDPDVADSLPRQIAFRDGRVESDSGSPVGAPSTVSTAGIR